MAELLRPPYSTRPSRRHRGQYQAFPERGSMVPWPGKSPNQQCRGVVCVMTPGLLGSAFSLAIY